MSKEIFKKKANTKKSHTIPGAKGSKQRTLKKCCLYSR
jgi:hypothetical protein